MNSEQLKDVVIQKIEKTNKLIFDSGNIDDTDSIRTFLEAEHELTDFDFVIENAGYGLYVVMFNKLSDREYLQNEAQRSVLKIDNEPLYILPFDPKILDTMKKVKKEIQEKNREEDKKVKNRFKKFIDIEKRNLFYQNVE